MRSVLDTVRTLNYRKLVRYLIIMFIAGNVSWLAFPDTKLFAQSPHRCYTVPIQYLQMREGYRPETKDGLNVNGFGYFRSVVTLTPRHTRGDRDFKGHGPRYDIAVNPVTGWSGLYVDVYMKAWEVDKRGYAKKDYTTAEQRAKLLAYKPPEGWYIDGYNLDVRGYRSSSIIYAPAIDYPDRWTWIRSTDRNGHNKKVHPLYQLNWIHSLGVIGDTKGPDTGVKTSVEVNLAVRDIVLCTS